MSFLLKGNNAVVTAMHKPFFHIVQFFFQEQNLPEFFHSVAAPMGVMTVPHFSVDI